MGDACVFMCVCVCVHACTPHTSAASDWLKVLLKMQRGKVNKLCVCVHAHVCVCVHVHVYAHARQCKCKQICQNATETD